MRLSLWVFGVSVMASSACASAESIGVGAATSDGPTVVETPLVRIEAAPGGGFEVFVADQMKPLLVEDQAGSAQQPAVWPMPGDVTLKGFVDFSDLLVVARNFGMKNATWADGDFNNDGGVGFDDIVALARDFGHHASAPDTAAAAPLPISFWVGSSLLCGYALIRMSRARTKTSA